MNRRHFLSKSTAASAAFLAPVALTQLTQCSKGDTKDAKKLHLFTWADYINPDVVTKFEEEFGCEVVIDTFDSNESMQAKLLAGATGYDVLVPSSYMVTALQRDQMIIDLDHAKLPNIANVDKDYLASAPDSAMKVSVPYMMAPTVLGILGSKVSNPSPSYSMYEREEVKGRSTMLDDMREVLGAALKHLGYSLNSTDTAQINEAADLVLKWKPNLAKFENEQQNAGLASGEFVLVQGYAGDLLMASGDNEDIQLLIPEVGAAFSCDNLCIPTAAPNPELAYSFIDFLTRPEVAAENMGWIEYRAPNTAAYEHVDPEFLKNATLFPPAEIFAKCEAIDDLGDALKIWTAAWDRVKAS